MCSGTLTNGSMVCNLTFSSEGTRTLVANYAGNSNFAPSSDTESHNVQAPAPSKGQLEITTSTSGTDQDSDGYRFAVDAGQEQQIGLNSTTTGSRHRPGSHTVVLSNVASNCTASGGGTASTTVSAGAASQVSFTVTCTAIPPSTRNTADHHLHERTGSGRGWVQGRSGRWAGSGDRSEWPVGAGEHRARGAHCGALGHRGEL